MQKFIRDNFNVDDFKNEKFAVNCQTEYQAQVFLDFLDGLGIKWVDEEYINAKENAKYNFKDFGKNLTYIYCNNGYDYFYGKDINGLKYGDIESAKSFSMKIYTYAEIFQTEIFQK